MSVSYVEHVLHDLILINMTVARFVGTGSFLIRYSNGRTKYITSPVKEVLPLFLTKIIPLI